MKEWAAAFLGALAGSALTLLVVFKIWPVLIVMGSVFLLWVVATAIDCLVVT